MTAQDHHGQAWWIAASSVWSDADAAGQPDNPLPIGLATAATRERAMVTGLSDRLGWEAVLEFERGRDLAPVDALSDDGAGRLGTANVVILDGRLGHDVPTVVVLGREMVRWGAGATWHAALRRALYGEDSTIGAMRELPDMCAMLARSGLGVAAVDLDTPLLRRAGIARCAVQLVTE